MKQQQLSPYQDAPYLEVCVKYHVRKGRECMPGKAYRTVSINEFDAKLNNDHSPVYGFFYIKLDDLKTVQKDEFVEVEGYEIKRLEDFKAELVEIPKKKTKE